MAASSSFRCTTCNNDLLVPMDGDESTLQRHRLLRHLKCRSCNKHYTPRRQREHELLYHQHACDRCQSRFTSAANLSRHKRKMHRSYACPLCPVSMVRVVYDGPALLNRHVSDRHHGKTVHHCDQCNSVYTSEANYRRHVAIVHKRQCVYCHDDDEVDDGTRRGGGGGGGGGARFATVGQLRQHIATSHSQHVCHFCGDMFTSNEGLYRHQTEHCQRRFKCVSCDREFGTLAACNAHMSSHVSRIGACSPHDTPSLTRHSMLWSKLQYRNKPWESGVQTIVGAGHLQDRINRHYQELCGRYPPGVGFNPRDEQNVRLRAYQNVSSVYRDRLRDVYRENLRQYVNLRT